MFITWGLHRSATWDTAQEKAFHALLDYHLGQDLLHVTVSKILSTSTGLLDLIRLKDNLLLNFIHYHYFFFQISVPVHLKEVTISTSVSYSLPKGHDDVMLHCNPIIEGIVDPSTITVDIKWWISSSNKENHAIIEEDRDSSKKKLIFEESFRLSTKTFSTLNRQYWAIGDTVSFT